jgi:hypothetical protein
MFVEGSLSDGGSFSHFIFYFHLKVCLLERGGSPFDCPTLHEPLENDFLGRPFYYFLFILRPKGIPTQAGFRNRKITIPFLKRDGVTR